MRFIFHSLIIALSLSTLACGPKDKDKLGDNELSAASGSKSAPSDLRCGGQGAQDELKRQLFARAAEIRGSNVDDYASIAGFALLELDDPAPANTAPRGAMVDCRARALLHLPPGLGVDGGRTELSGDITYSVASGTVTLGESNSLAIPLATLGREEALAPERSATPIDQDRQPNASEPAFEAQPEPPAAQTVERIVVRPSFDCRRARTDGEVAVCENPALAALDREMAAQYRDAIADSDPEDRLLLAQTRDRFLGFRDRCGSDACIANSYRGRMREIDDIVAGRWGGGR